MRAARFRWSAPDRGNRGAARRTREEAMVEGVGVASGRRADGLDADTVLRLWRSLEAAGWTIEEVGP